MAKKLPISEKREWLKLYESGKSEISIAKTTHHDARTVKKALDDARRERDARLARADLLKEALRRHQGDLENELRQTSEGLATPDVGLAPLSWYEVGAWAQAPTPSGAGQSPEPTTQHGTTLEGLVREHLSGDRAAKKIKQWQGAFDSHVVDRASLQRLTVSLLRSKTGLALVGTGHATPPFLYAHTAGPAVYESAISIKLDRQPRPDLAHEMQADDETHAVKYRHDILAEGVSDPRKCRQSILDAHAELLVSAELAHVVASYRNLEQISPTAIQSIEEILLLGFVPGQCRICRRIAG